MMPVIYIAGPFTAPNSWDRERNIRKAEELGFDVAKLGAMPLIPHTNTRFFEGTLTPEFWYEGTLMLLAKSDACLVALESKGSKGTNQEIVVAKGLGIPLFYEGAIDQLREWIPAWKDSKRYGTLEYASELAAG